MKRTIKNVFACIMMLVLVATMTEFPFALAEGLDTNENEPIAEETTYFIPYSEFTFTGSNTGNLFYVPQLCTGRIMIGAVATDGNGGTITVKLHNVDGTTIWQASFSSGDTIFDTFTVGAGDHYFTYSLNRNAPCLVGIQFYTWSY